MPERGGNAAPGQNTVLEGPVTEPITIPADAITNGRMRFTTDPAVLTAAAAAGRPRAR